MARLDATERRRHLVDAAVAEFAASGYHAASTAAIARRAGISQPYVYALFPSKRDLFLAAHRRAAERVREALVAAAEGAGAEPGDRLQAMGEAYLLLVGERTDVLCQLQAYAAAGDAKLREEVRAEFLRTFEAVQEAAGSREEAAFFLAGGAFLTIAAALEVPLSFWP